MPQLLFCTGESLTDIFWHEYRQQVTICQLLSFFIFFPFKDEGCLSSVLCAVTSLQTAPGQQQLWQQEFVLRNLFNSPPLSAFRAHTKINRCLMGFVKITELTYWDPE